MRKCLLPILSFWMLNSLVFALANEESGSRDIAKTVEALKRIKVAEISTTVPKAARPLLTTLKHQLRDLIQKSLNNTIVDANDSAKAQTAVVAELKKQNIAIKSEESESDDSDSFVYGADIDLSIDKLKDYKDLIAATTTIGVCCGDDTSFYLFKKKGEQWNLILAQESNGYAEVNGAQGSFGYAVSPPDAQGQFFVATKNITPWCTSNWQQIRYMALRPGPTAYAPKILLKRNETIFLGGENDGSITTKTDGLAIEFETAQELDIGATTTRKHSASYKIVGNQVTRIAPLAEEPEGFLDEWFNLPWNDASKWIEGVALADISNWHARIHTERSDPESNRFSSEFLYVPPACRIGDKQWQIGLQFSVDKGKSLPLGMPSKAYFTVGQNNRGDYVIQDVSKTGSRKCRK